MSTPSAILNHYQTIANVSGQMLAQARANRWDSVLTLADQYRNAIELLRNMNPLSSEDRQARQHLLIQILDDDAKLRDLASPELRRLGVLLGQIKRQQSVLRTYSAQHARST
ncbi:MAG: flagellar protein FliT [Paralcaligenes sp.]